MLVCLSVATAKVSCHGQHANMSECQNTKTSKWWLSPESREVDRFPLEPRAYQVINNHNTSRLSTSSTAPEHLVHTFYF